MYSTYKTVLLCYLFACYLYFFFGCSFVFMNIINYVFANINITTILPYLKLLFATTFKFDFMSPARAPGIHFTMVTDVASFIFLRMALSITRVGFSTRVPLSRDNLFKM